MGPLVPRECYRSSSLQPTSGTEAGLGLLSWHLYICSSQVISAATPQPGPKKKSLFPPQVSILLGRLKEKDEQGGEDVQQEGGSRWLAEAERAAGEVGGEPSLRGAQDWNEMRRAPRTARFKFPQSCSPSSAQAEPGP